MYITNIWVGVFSFFIPGVVFGLMIAIAIVEGFVIRERRREKQGQPRGKENERGSSCSI